MVRKLDEICNFYFHHHHLSTKNLVCDEKALAACSELLLKALVRTRTNTNINENNLSFASALVFRCLMLSLPSVHRALLSPHHTVCFIRKKIKLFCGFVLLLLQRKSVSQVRLFPIVRRVTTDTFKGVENLILFPSLAKLFFLLLHTRVFSLFFQLINFWHCFWCQPDNMGRCCVIIVITSHHDHWVRRFREAFS